MKSCNGLRSDMETREIPAEVWISPSGNQNSLVCFFPLYFLTKIFVFKFVYWALPFAPCHLTSSIFYCISNFPRKQLIRYRHRRGTSNLEIDFVCTSPQCHVMLTFGWQVICSCWEAKTGHFDLGEADSHHWLSRDSVICSSFFNDDLGVTHWYGIS